MHDTTSPSSGLAIETGPRLFGLHPALHSLLGQGRTEEVCVCTWVFL